MLIRSVIMPCMLLWCCRVAAAEAELREGAIVLDVRVAAEVSELVIELESSRNRPVVRHADRSPLAPPGWVHKADRTGPNRQVWYPVIDIAADERTEAVVELSGAGPGHWAFNPMFHRQTAPLAATFTVPRAQFEPWENLLYVETDSAEHNPMELRRFAVRTRRPVTEGRLQCRIELRSPRWQGSVRWRAASSDDSTWLGSADIAGPPLASEHDDPAAWGPAHLRPSHLQVASADAIPREQLLAGLRDCVQFVLAARNTWDTSPTRGGFFLLYDLDAQTYRTSHWMWSWGVIIRMLLEASEVPEVAAAFEENLVEVATAAGLRTLEFQHERPGHDIDGLLTARWNPGPQYERGAQEFVATADALFLAGWAWAPLYEATGDGRFLQATERLCAACNRLSLQYEVVPQDWLPATGQWKVGVLNEVGFGAEGFAELHRVNPRRETLEAGRRFIDQLIERLERDDGLWERAWSPARPPSTFGVRHTRGQGWAMEGLLAAHRLAPDAGYLPRAERLARHLIEHQQPAGCWAFMFDEDPRATGIAEKGTAVWSALLYQLHAANGDARALAAARRALRYCLSERYTGDDPHARGGIVGCGPNSGIVYRPWQRIACTYTSGFMGLAIARELALHASQ